MPCDTQLRKGITRAAREAQVKAALAALEVALAAGKARAVIGPQGAVAFAGAWERDGVSDACAYRRLLSARSPALLRAVARAEATAGRQVDRRAIAAGHHSHDGGRTWGVD